MKKTAQYKEIKEKNRDKNEVESGYVTDTETISSKKYKSRLLVGEGNFTYSKSVVKKHEVDKPELGKFIIATELENEDILNKEEGFIETVNYLKSKGVTIEFKIDARTLDKSFNDHRFKRIQFNCPFAGNGVETTNLVFEFFKSAKELQKEGDRIQMKLVDSNATWYLGRTYNIIEASAKTGYLLIKKRKFDKERYPEYKHRVTTGNRDREKEFSGHEYIFEKTNKNYEELITLSKIKEQNHTIYRKTNDNLEKTEEIKYLIPNLETDNDSTSYNDDSQIEQISYPLQTDSTEISNKRETKMYQMKPTTKIPEPIEQFIKLLKSKDYPEIIKKLQNPLGFDINYVIKDEWDHDFDKQTRSVFGGGFEYKALIHIAIDNLNVESMRIFLAIKDLNLKAQYIYNDNQDITDVGFSGGGGQNSSIQEVKEHTLIEYACNREKMNVAFLLLEKGVRNFSEKNLKNEQYQELVKYIEKLNSESLPPSVNVQAIANSNLLPETEKTKELETENKKLKAEIQELRQIKQELDNYIEQATGKKNFSQNVLKRKAILQVFFARKKAKRIKEEIKKEAPEYFKKFAEEKKYDKIKELAESLEKEQYHKARQIMQERAELEFTYQEQKIKY